MFEPRVLKCSVAAYLAKSTGFLLIFAGLLRPPVSILGGGVAERWRDGVTFPPSPLLFPPPCLRPLGKPSPGPCGQLSGSLPVDVVALLPLEEEGANEDRRRLLENDTPREAGVSLKLPGLGGGVVTGLL